MKARFVVMLCLVTFLLGYALAGWIPATSTIDVFPSRGWGGWMRVMRSLRIERPGIGKAGQKSLRRCPSRAMTTRPGGRSERDIAPA